VISIADSYLARLGVEYRPPAAHGMNFSLGARLEGVPVRDLVGTSEGFRRPGYIVSAEPQRVRTARRWSLACLCRSRSIAIVSRALRTRADSRDWDLPAW